MSQPSAPKPTIGVILLQLGTPDAPTTAAVRRYLRQFLSDPRVIDLNRLVWLPILYGIVLRTRPAASAKLYQRVWTKDGSPLLMITRAQARALESRLNQAGIHAKVVVGMRYGSPSVESALDELTRAGIDRVLAFPMYPQYRRVDGIEPRVLFQHARKMRVVPSLRVVPPYYADANYIDALAVIARESLAARSAPPTRLLLSFHGLPQRYADEGDPYAEHCRATAARLETALALRDTAVEITFQSRFGREKWLPPYTDIRLAELGSAQERVAVMCPGFTADCLETLEEIALRGHEQFREGGGTDYQAIPCLNEHPAWLDAMAAIASRELAGWRD